MAQQADFIVSESHTNIKRILRLLEEVDALADKTVVQWNALGGASSVSGYDWPADLTEAQFTTAISTLSSKPWDIGGSGHDTNLYRVKTAF